MMVNKYANSKLFSFTASSPTAHVIPRRGRITTEALISFLLEKYIYAVSTIAVVVEISCDVNFLGHLLIPTLLV